MYPFQKREAHILRKNVAYRPWRLASAHHYPAEVHKCTAITRIVLNMKEKTHLQNI
ncbi:hypothetical protein AHZ27_004226 [Salmonella enterica subsp. enterica serovar Alachua]|nr:hypothetical protein [Salmonella enterica subsp. enterica serovar Alachua]